jgi:hypothetical protein
MFSPFVITTLIQPDITLFYIISRVFLLLIQSRGVLRAHNSLI